MHVRLHTLNGEDRDTSNNDRAQSYSIEPDFNYSLSTKIDTLNAYTANKDTASNTITLEQLKNTSFHDKDYQKLIHQIKEGFPKTRQSVNSVLRPLWEVLHCLNTCDSIISVDDRRVIPTSLQNKILHMLHSARQGVANMTARANVSVYWSGINKSISTTQYNCKNCNDMTPLHPKEPLILSLPPE